MEDLTEVKLSDLRAVHPKLYPTLESFCFQLQNMTPDPEKWGLALAAVVDILITNEDLTAYQARRAVRGLERLGVCLAERRRLLALDADRPREKTVRTRIVRCERGGGTRGKASAVR